MPVPVLSIAEMRRWEAITWSEGQTEAAVIDRVGQAIATRLLELTPPQAKILILAGKGNNGADAKAAAAQLEPFREIIPLDIADPKQAIHRLRAALSGLR